MTLFLDASALLRDLLLDEGGDEVRAERARRPVAASALLLPECRSGFRRLRVEGRITMQEVDGHARDLLAIWTQANIVELTREISERASDLVARHEIRGADACVLASALLFGPNVTLASFDYRMRWAASAEGLGMVPEVLPA